MTRIWPSIEQAVSHAAHVSRAPLGWDPTDHLLSRFAFGPTAAARAYLARYGATGWYEQQVRIGRSSGGYLGSPSVAEQGPLLARSPAEVRAYLAGQGNQYGWTAMEQLTRVTLGLQAFSSAQLYETLVDFFSNHLNVANHNGDVWITRHAYDRDVIRKYAMGSFADMLAASARHPAMLIYLNLAESTKAAINENYGRELLELHTVGLRYSEADVRNGATLLTGRTVTRDAGSYCYDAARHPTGPVRVLGFSHPNASNADGEAGGDALIHYLAAHPWTAQHLAHKLCVRYVSDNPSTALVDAVAGSYLAHGTQILPMVQTILCSEEFWSSRGLKVRRPAENLLATIRVLGTPVTDMSKALDTLHWMSSGMGHTPLDWPTPDGYPDVATSWRSSSTLLYLWNLHLGFAGDWWAGFGKSDKTKLYAHRPHTSGEAITLLTQRLTGMTFSPGHRAALQRFLGEPSSTPIASSRLRWLLSPLIALILDAPHHALR